MKSISLKAPASLGIAKIAQRVMKSVIDHKISLGISGAVAAYLGALCSADAMMYAGAMLAMVAIAPIEKKGGER